LEDELCATVANRPTPLMIIFLRDMCDIQQSS
jgi:hypothetical protein